MNPIRRVRRRATAVFDERRLTRRGASLGVRGRAMRDREHGAHDAGSLIVAPPGAGNIGDQAMFEAYLENTPGRVTVVERHAGDILVPEEDVDRVRLVELPQLIFGRGSERVRDLDAYRALVRDATDVAVVGADMMDGVYTLVGSVNRALLAELAARAGVPSRILGFSWSDRARPAALRALNHAVSAGAVAVARDPDSAGRLRSGGVSPIVDGSDIVFSARALVHGAVAEVDRARPFAVLNVSALLARTIDARAYSPVVRQLTAAGLQVVLVPHVLRGSSDDLAAARAVEQLHPEVQLIDWRLSPPEVRGLVSDARLVVTGRMHLAIMAMMGGVPAITFATQGKVQGLMRLLGTERLCVEPGPDLADRVAPLVVELLAEDDVRLELHRRLPDVTERSRANFLQPSRAAVAV